jgi:hypothetical protein
VIPFSYFGQNMTYEVIANVKTSNSYGTLIANRETGGLAFAVQSGDRLSISAGIKTDGGYTYNYTSMNSFQTNAMISFSGGIWNKGNNQCGYNLFNGTDFIQTPLTLKAGEYYEFTQPGTGTDIYYMIGANPLPYYRYHTEPLIDTDIYSVRIYNIALNEAQIRGNAALDQKRYLAPPTVTIGGKACTEVIVLSKNILMCRVPEGDATGDNIGVTLNGEAYSQYKYVHPDDDFYISSISPIAGPANNPATLTLEGNLLNTITGVEIDGTPCPYITPQGGEDESKIRRYTLPAHTAGEVDIIVTTGTTSYRFAKVFEYQ